MEKTYEIVWVICNKKTLEAEMHQLGFGDANAYWEQIRYLIEIHTKRQKSIETKFTKDRCVITVWS